MLSLVLSLVLTQCRILITLRPIHFTKVGFCSSLSSGVQHKILMLGMSLQNMWSSTNELFWIWRTYYLFILSWKIRRGPKPWVYIRFNARHGCTIVYMYNWTSLYQEEAQKTLSVYVLKTYFNHFLKRCFIKHPKNSRKKKLVVFWKLLVQNDV